MKILKIITIFLLGCYLLLCIGAYFVQDLLILKPQKLPKDHVFRLGKEVEINVEKNISLNCLWLKSSNAKGVILYLHGNRGNNRRCLYQAQNMSSNQYDIFMPDYRGYGKSGGKIYSEDQLYHDVQVVYDFLKQHYAEDQIVLVGYSLGSGMASWLAANNHPKRLILLAPYVSFVDLKNRYAFFLPSFLIKYPLDNKKHLASVQCPVTLFHGTDDELIPYNSSEILQQVKPQNIELVPLRREGHRGVIFNGAFRSKIQKLLAM